MTCFAPFDHRDGHRYRCCREKGHDGPHQVQWNEPVVLQCDALRLEGLQSEQCTLVRGHYGVHITASGKEWPLPNRKEWPTLPNHTAIYCPTCKELVKCTWNPLQCNGLKVKCEKCKRTHIVLLDVEGHFCESTVTKDGRVRVCGEPWGHTGPHKTNEGMHSFCWMDRA
jgi:hypothetical protein